MSSRLISVETRQRLRTQQLEEASAVSAHAVGNARLEGVVTKRAEVISAQDELVATGSAMAESGGSSPDSRCPSLSPPVRTATGLRSTGRAGVGLGRGGGDRPRPRFRVH